MSNTSQSPQDDGVREIFPVRMVTTENVTDFRPRIMDADEPDEPVGEDESGKDGADSVQESVSLPDLTPSTELPVLTTGVQLPVSVENGPAEKK